MLTTRSAECSKPRVISVCSSVGGMDLGFDRAGFETVAFCEVDPWRRSVLAHHWPGVPIWDDLTTLDPAELPEADVLIGGTPCQDLSVAGKRAGLDGARSGLFFDYIRIRHERNIEWCVWENVAGALSSNGGLDFALVLGALVGATVNVPAGGWSGAGVASGPWGGACWRLLDAQHFGVPQRRRRIFVVGHLGGPCPPEILLELESGGGDSPARAEARTGLAGSVADGARTARTLTGGGRLDGETEDFVVIGTDATRERESSWLSGYAARGTGRQQRAGGSLDPDVISTLQGGGKRGYRIDAEAAAGGHLIVRSDDV